MHERRAPHQHVQVLHCHGDSLKFARRHGHIYNYITIYDGELYIVRLILNTLQNIRSRFMKFSRSYCNTRNLRSVLSVEI